MHDDDDENGPSHADLPTKVTARSPIAGRARSIATPTETSAVRPAEPDTTPTGPSAPSGSARAPTLPIPQRPPGPPRTTAAFGTMNVIASTGIVPEIVESVDDVAARSALDGTRLLAGSMLLWCLVGIPMIVLAPGAFNDKLICVIGIVVVASGYGWLYRRAHQAGAVDMDALLPLSVLSALAGQMIALGTGICSPYAGLIALSLTLFCTSASDRSARIVYLVVAGTHLTLGALAIFGVVSSTGVLDPTPRDWQSILLNVGWVEAVYATSFAIGRAAHRENARLMSRFESAVREAAQRDALWREVRAELDRAAQLGGPGQFTGQSLGGYKLAEVIGRGGMGEVYAAHRVDDGSEVAVKLLRRDALSDADVVARFEREASIVEGLCSPNVVTVHQIGGREAPVPFIAMERLRGTDLATELRNLGTLPMQDAITLIVQVAAGLDVAHAAGIVHRDLKPSNLFHSEDATGARTWKILDFGVSKLVTSDEVTLTVNQLVGTPQYMAPEQAAGTKALDHRADVHSLAAIAYRALSGRMAFAKGDLGRVLLAVATEIPDDPRRHADIPEELALVLRIGLAKKPKDRFDGALAFARAFSEAASGRITQETRERAHRLLAAEPWGAKVDRP